MARCSSPQGILRVGDGNFAAALRAEVGAWLAEGEKHVLMCGMIGSRQGWVEAAISSLSRRDSGSCERRCPSAIS